jgi:hypothetical protein
MEEGIYARPLSYGKDVDMELMVEGQWSQGTEKEKGWSTHRREAAVRPET